MVRANRLITLFVAIAVAAGFFPASARGSASRIADPYTWTKTGLQGLKITGLAISRKNPGLLFAATFGHDEVNIARTIDGGVHWTNVGQQLADLHGMIWDVQIDPYDQNLVYAATPFGVFKSANSGDSWRGPLSPASQILAVDPSTPGVLFMGQWPGGVYKSTDGGETWAPAGNGIVGQWVAVLEVDPHSSSTVYCGTEQGFFKSINGGLSWFAINSGLPNSAGQALAIDPLNPNILLAGVGSCVDGDLYKSTDGGQTWLQSSTGLPGQPILGLMMDPRWSSIVYASTKVGMYRSSDGGRNWGRIDNGMGWQAVMDLAFACLSSPRLYAASLTDGVYVMEVPQPTVTINFATGAPGSYFKVVGTNVPNVSPVTVHINGVTLGTLSPLSDGYLEFAVSTHQADVGRYYISVQSDQGVFATSWFVLDATQPVRALEPTVVIWPIPAGIALAHSIYLPLVVR